MSDMPSQRSGTDGGLPDWLADAFATSVATETGKVAQSGDVSLRSSTEWPLLVDAALVSGFLPRELAPDSLDADGRRMAESAILRLSETTLGPEGPRWTLSEGARIRVISEVVRAGTLAQDVEQTARRFNDPVSLAMRDCLQKSAPLPMDLPSLETRRVALSWLSSVPGLDLPSIEQLDREIDRRRLLGQFARMIGRSPEAPESDRGECFFGRGDEMQKLRNHVGVVADSLANNAVQVVGNVLRAVGHGRTVMTMWGVGGVGKTTLVSKFMLEHALAAETGRLPYAYLDFDRAVITARDRAGLLIEICTQVAAQFGDLAEPLASLKTRLQDAALKMAARPEGDSISLLRPCLYEFRTVLDAYLKARESFVSTATPFLLVFDTFEIVQYTPDDVVNLEDFVFGFSGPQERGVWSRLRLVIAGRKKVERFLGPIDERDDVALGALNAEGSADMLVALARDCGKPITKSQADGLVGDLARVARQRVTGVQPLRLKLVGAILRNTDGTGPDIVKELRRELSEPLTAGGTAGKTLIDGVLVRRVLGHVADARVRALADPGLVVRRITPGVIREVMARGTPDPKCEVPPGDAPDTREMWEVSPEEAGDIFNAFRREVTLVEQDGPDALYHRADVRQEMLPLIQARSRRQFDRVQQLAFDYFSKAATSDPVDARSAGEAIYHGLWLQRPLEEIDRIWRRREATFDPRINPEEFADDSIANIYLRAKRGDKVAPGELRRLPEAVALDWLDSRGSDMLGQRSVDDTVDAMRSVAGPDFRALDSREASAALLARLLFRAGLWHEAAALLQRQLTNIDTMAVAQAQPEDPIVSLLRTWSTVVAKAPAAYDRREGLWAVASAVPDRVAAVEVLAHMRLFDAAQVKESAEVGRFAREKIDEAIRAVPIDRWMHELRILRLAILTTTDDPRPLIAAYAQRNERLPRHPDLLESIERLVRELVGVSEKEAELVFKDLRSSKTPTLAAFEALDEFWRRRVRPLFVTAIHERAELLPDAQRLIVYDHADWRWVLGNALSRELKDDSSLVSRLVSGRFIAARRGADERDGLSIVQAAADEGRMLELARQLEDWSRFRNHYVEPDDVPRDVYGVARALLRWHETLVRVTERSS